MELQNQCLNFRQMVSFETRFEIFWLTICKNNCDLQESKFYFEDALKRSTEFQTFWDTLIDQSPFDYPEEIQPILKEAWNTARFEETCEVKEDPNEVKFRTWKAKIEAEEQCLNIWRIKVEIDRAWELALEKKEKAKKEYNAAWQVGGPLVKFSKF